MNQLNKIEIYDDIYDLDTMASLYDVAKHVLMPPSTFYLSFQDYLNGGRQELSNYFPRQFIDFLFLHIENIINKSSMKFEPDYGFEIWIGNSGKNSKSSGYLHVDNDEFLRVKTNIIETPLIGTILYITPNTYITDGETLFVTESLESSISLFEEHDKNVLLEIRGAKLVKPISGRLVIFDGEMPHAVMPFILNDHYNSRINLLINVWKQRISSVPNGVTYINLNQ